MFIHKTIYAVKTSIAYFLFFAGFLHIYKLLFFKNKCIALMYHRVLDDDDIKKNFSHDGIIVRKKTFIKHIHFLKKNFNILSIDGFTQSIEKKDLNGFPCLITFDDGWIDNYTEALPVLKKYNVPATIFLPVDYIGSKLFFWQERLGGLLYAAYSDQRYSNILSKYKLEKLKKLAAKEARKFIKQYISQIKGKSLAEIDAIIKDISSQINQNEAINYQTDTFLDWKQVGEMDGGIIGFGAHGVSHRILTKIAPADVNGEIKGSKDIIENKLNKKIISFAFPNGDHNVHIVNELSKEGYKIAFTTKRGHISKNDDPLMLNRINIHDGAAKNIPMFFSRILGIF